MNTNSYFTVECTRAGNLSLVINGSGGTPTACTFYYWKNTTPNAARDNYTGTITTSSTVQNISMAVGDTIMFYRSETTAIAGAENEWNTRIYNTSNTEYKISGNIASLIGFNKTIPAYCFRYLFYNAGIVDASELELPWNTLNTWSCARMFMNDTKMVNPPYLPAENLAESCYQWMFRGCTALKTIAKMGVKNLAKNSCYAMYQLSGGFTSVTVPIVDTYEYHSFDRFLAGNKTITEAIVETPESVTASGVFYYLFDDCTNLSKITCLLKSWSSDNQFANWTRTISATGTFIKHPDATWSSGISGIPTGWTVKNMNPQVQSLDFNDVNAVYVKGNIGISAIYGQNNQLLWSKNTNI